MPAILTEEHYKVSTTNDIVVLKLGSHTIKLFYQTALEIAAGMRMAAKMGMRYEGVRTQQWREILKNAQLKLPKIPRRNKVFRRSNEPSNISAWSVDWDRQLVVVKFDSLTATLHYTDALYLHALLRGFAKVAKAWAGDEGRTRRTVAYLNDAEENDKFVYAA
ncbi:MAG: hypothetical protein V3S69_00600 [Dehalococcoidales bacterium]